MKHRDVQIGDRFHRASALVHCRKEYVVAGFRQGDGSSPHVRLRLETEREELLISDQALRDTTLWLRSA